MRRILLSMALSFGLSIGYAQINNKDCNGGDSNSPKIAKPEAAIGDKASMIMVRPVDPNELKGPVGVDSVRWVSKQDVLNYTVLFENDPEFATAHAQIVDIRVDLPYTELLDGFALGTYTFANRAFEMPGSPNFYSMRLDCRDSLKIYVDVLAGLEVEKSQAFWHFSSIDPETGYAPWQVDRGMLPVNDSTHIGEGFVTFSFKPHEAMVTGDTIGFNARILFDYNDTIPTNYWCNKIDAGAPTSEMKATVDNEDHTHYRLSFNAEDDENGCGVKQIRLYLADNLGTYNEYAVCAVDSILDFTIEQGKQYHFMTIAEDRVGNREAIKTAPDLILNFNEPPTDLLLSETTFQDDIELKGFIAELSTVDADNKGNFTYALAEGDGAIHNDMFSVVGNRLQANDCFKCADVEQYSIRLSTTDEGGLYYSKSFTLQLRRVLEEPEPQELNITICEGDFYEFYGKEYAEAGTFVHRKANDYMCDSVYILNLQVISVPEIPIISVSDKSTLISSAEYGNQWYKDGVLIDGATGKLFTAVETGVYSVTASNGECESGHSEAVYVNLDARSEIKIELMKGWNWISSNVEDESVSSPNIFFAAILDNIKTITAANGTLRGANGTLTGSLNAITPETYKVEMSEPSILALNAALVDAENFRYNMQPGWNWIPYIPIVELEIETAFRHLQPSPNDVIKSHTAFATYADGKWCGTLKTLTPNSGYMYYAHQALELGYSASRVQKISTQMNSREMSSLWNADATNYADNMTVIAKVYDDGVPAFDAAYTIAAFCGEECRGIGEYVGDKVFITIHGNEGDEITFKAEENATGREVTVEQTLAFDEQPIGTMSSPYTINIKDGSGLDDVTAVDFTIYPNPVRDIMYVAGEISAINTIKIISSSGEIVIAADTFEHGVNVTSLPDGVYVAALVTSKGVIYRKFSKVGTS